MKSQGMVTLTKDGIGVHVIDCQIPICEVAQVQIIPQGFGYYIKVTALGGMELSFTCSADIYCDIVNCKAFCGKIINEKGEPYVND